MNLTADQAAIADVLFAAGVDDLITDRHAEGVLILGGTSGSVLVRASYDNFRLGREASARDAAILTAAGFTVDRLNDFEVQAS